MVHLEPTKEFNILCPNCDTEMKIVNNQKLLSGTKTVRCSGCYEQIDFTWSGPKITATPPHK